MKKLREKNFGECFKYRNNIVEVCKPLNKYNLRCEGCQFIKQTQNGRNIRRCVEKHNCNNNKGIHIKIFKVVQKLTPRRLTYLEKKSGYEIGKQIKFFSPQSDTTPKYGIIVDIEKGGHNNEIIFIKVEYSWNKFEHTTYFELGKIKEWNNDRFRQHKKV